MKTIDELSKTDREIMEQEYVKSYRKPPILVAFMYLFGMLSLLAVFGVLVYGFVGLLYQIIL
jgi:nitrate reductase NapE component